MNELEQLAHVRQQVEAGNWSSIGDHLNMEATMKLCVKIGGAALVTEAGYILRANPAIGNRDIAEWVPYHGQCQTQNCYGYEQIDPYTWDVYREVEPEYLCGYHAQQRHDDI